MRALLITSSSPWGASFGAQQRSALLYEALTRELPVDVLLLEEGRRNDAVDSDRAEILARIVWKQPPWTLYKYRVNAWADGWCKANIDWRKYALVASRYLTPMTKIEWPRHVRTIVDCDDAFYRYPPQGSGVLGRVLASARSRARKLQTMIAIRKYDHAFFCSLRDRRMFPVRSSSILPNVVQAPPAPLVPRQATEGAALIVGSMWYPPNRHGVDWFLERCWPAIAATCPALRLRIVGPASAGDRQRWARAVRTETPGFVEDLAAEYAGALFAIAPIHFGGGTSIKFLESGAYFRACVVTGHIYEAFRADFRDGDSVLVGRTEEGMVEACVTLFGDAQRRNAIARQAYEIVTSLYTVRRFTDTVQAAVRQQLHSVVA